MKKKIIFTIILFATAFTASAQNQYSILQYMLHHAFINPAATGNDAELNAALFYRSQWVGMKGAPVTQGLSLNAPLGDGTHSVGFYGFNDKIGVNKQMSFAGSYAFNARLAEKRTLAFGLSASLDLRQSNFSEIIGETAGDPVFQGDSKMFAMPNFRFGTYYYSERFYAGFSIPNLLENKIIYENALKGNTSFNVKDLHLYFHGGYSFSLNENLDLNVSSLVKESSGAPMQIDVNTQLFVNSKFGLGATYRTSEDIGALVNFQITPMFKLGYAYDYSFSKLGKYSNGSHEIILIYRRTEPGKPAYSAPRF